MCLLPRRVSSPLSALRRQLFSHSLTAFSPIRRAKFSLHWSIILYRTLLKPPQNVLRLHHQLKPVPSTLTSVASTAEGAHLFDTLRQLHSPSDRVLLSNLIRPRQSIMWPFNIDHLIHPTLDVVRSDVYPRERDLSLVESHAGLSVS